MEHELTIESYSPKGYGTAHLPSGSLIEIAHSVVGDRLQVEQKSKSRGIKKGRLLQVLSPSLHRKETRCKHAILCGGCCWQQIDYLQQLKIKESIVSSYFPGVSISPILPCLPSESSEALRDPTPWQYRNKMEFSFSENRAGMKYLGLMIAQAEPYVFNVEECFISPSWITEGLSLLRSWWLETNVAAYKPRDDAGILRYVTFRYGFRTNQKMIVLNVSCHEGLSQTHLELLKQKIASLGEVSLFLRVHQTKKGKPTQFYEMHLAGPDHIQEILHLDAGALTFKISPISFFQPNTIQAERLYQLALNLCAAFKPDLILDLYCGTGTISLAASKVGKRVVGIELSPEAVLDAEENMALNKIDNCQFYQGDVGKVLSELKLGSPDVVIVDPPRAGLDDQTIEQLLKLGPKGIVYISCNPKSQAENISEIVKRGYKLQKIQPVDQFPHTYHIENIALLVRNEIEMFH
jgi:23S rRNA (uracil1939-C5)-methyltransferase